MGPCYIFLSKLSLLSNSLYYLLENKNIFMSCRVLVVVDGGSLASQVPTVVFFFVLFYTKWKSKRKNECNKCNATCYSKVWIQC